LQVLKKNGYEIDAIVYLTFNEKKQLDFSSYSKDESEKVSKKLINLSAFSHLEKFTLVSWLEEIMHSYENNKDVYCFIYQYYKLLLHLKSEIMNYELMNDFYEDIIKKDFNNAIAFYELFANIDEFLIKRIENKFKTEQININPFSKFSIYNGYEAEDRSFITIFFEGFQNYGIEIARYWEEGYKNKYIVTIFDWKDFLDKKRKIKDFISKNKMEKLFKSSINDLYWEDWIRYYRVFDLNNENEMIEFVKELFEKLEKEKSK
jgi:hypothetical protein